MKQIRGWLKNAFVSEPKLT